jgi:hypothetical protein
VRRVMGDNHHHKGKSKKVKGKSEEKGVGDTESLSSVLYLSKCFFGLIYFAFCLFTFTFF